MFGIVILKFICFIDRLMTNSCLEAGEIRTQMCTLFN